MPTALRKKPTAPEGEIREGEEGPDEEEMDSTSGKTTNRKRSAKGAKNTKAPMDAECGCGGKGRKGKAACDGTCGGGMKRDRTDALTPQEYLAACELGIQGRSRVYIRSRLDTAMNLTPATVRTDLKCGKGAISEGEKCTKGPAQKVDPKAAAKKEFKTLMGNPVAAHRFNKAKGNTKGIGNKIKATGELAARLGGGAVTGTGVMQMMQGVMSGNVGQISRGYRNMQLGGAAIQTAAASKASRMGKTGLANEFLKSAGRSVALGVGQEAVLGAYAGFNRAGGVAGARRGARRAYQSARMRASGIRTMKRDSVYAAGFSPDPAALAL